MDLYEERDQRNLLFQELARLRSEWEQFEKDFTDLVVLFNKGQEDSDRFRWVALSLEDRRKWLTQLLAQHPDLRVWIPEIEAVERELLDRDFTGDGARRFLLEYLTRNRHGVVSWTNERPKKLLAAGTKALQDKVKEVRDQVEELVGRVETLPKPLPAEALSVTPAPVPPRSGKIRGAWKWFSHRRVAQETYKGFWEGWRKYVVWPGLLLLLGLLAETCDWINVVPNP